MRIAGADDKMKDYLTSQDEVFLEICRSIARALRLQIRDISKISGGCQIFAVEEESKWRNVRKVPRMIRCLRASETVDESAVRNLHEEMKRVNVNKGMLIASAAFSGKAYEFAESRPIALVNKEKLSRLLSVALKE